MPFDFDSVYDRRESSSIKWAHIPEGAIAMGMADMDFASAPAITAALRERAQYPLYGYTFPPKTLIASLVGWLNERYQAEADPDWIVPLSGIVPALGVSTRLDRGGVVANTPNYPMILHAVKRSGKEDEGATEHPFTAVPLTNKDEQYTIDFNALDSLAPSDATLFFLCNPHNPVGRVYDRSELEALSRLSAARGWTVISDEIHCELIYEKAHIPFWTIGEYAREHSVTFYSPGKTYNLPGIPFAFAVIPNAELRARFNKINYGMSMPGAFSYAAAEAAYSEAGAWRDELIEYLRGNRDWLAKTLFARFPKARYPQVEGTYLQWIDFTAYGLTDPAAFLLEKARVIISDGRMFGVPGYVRLNYGCPRATLERALNQMEEAFAGLLPLDS
ncbi:MAG: aminotransferase class I/II-fold pyridoxal phosphate-dependent enzyme [Oscillospiraceae bacterium]|jgi:cystathionine beta-lyase|nr:aminotransferase class I/II-fold pyridoxal phosphate-dependent enzyme [Oscillospiraceae bacterium]